MLSVTLLLVLAAAEPALPTLAVFPLLARTGVSKDTAEFMTDRLLERVRASGRFKRVIGTGEIELAISLEQRRQLVDCDSTSCLTEIAGALNVDRLLHGSAGRVGDLYAVSL